jgi:TolB-like protein
MKNEYFGDFLFPIMLMGTLLFLGCASAPSTRNANVSLDSAIKIAVENLEQGVGQSSPNNAISDASSAEKEMQNGQTDFDSIRQRAQGFTQKPVIAVLSFNSTANTLSAYIVEELSLALASSNRFTVVDRQRLDIIRQEENFQLSGEVSDETAQSIGRKLGAQYVITGSLLKMGNYYRFRVVPLHVETAAINAPTSININQNDTEIRYFLDGARVTQDEENRIAKERRTAAEREDWWEETKASAYLNMIQYTGIAFQSDEDFSYIFDEFGIRWSFLPFTSIGFDLAFGANTDEPVSFSTHYYYFSGGRYGRAEELKAMGLKEEEERPMFYGYISIAAGLVLPLTKSDASVRFHLFGNGLIQYGTTVYLGLLGDSFTPGFDVGFNFAIRNFWGLGMNIKYKGLWYQNNRYTNGILFGFTISPSGHNN